jgi:hypothetical protein
MGHHESSVVIKGSSVVIRGHQGSSEVIRGHPGSSVLTSVGSYAKSAWLRPASHLTSSYLMRMQSDVISRPSAAITRNQTQSGRPQHTRVTTGGPDAQFRQAAVGRPLRVEAQRRDGEDAARACIPD